MKKLIQAGEGWEQPQKDDKVTGVPPPAAAAGTRWSLSGGSLLTCHLHLHLVQHASGSNKETKKHYCLRRPVAGPLR